MSIKAIEAKPMPELKRIQKDKGNIFYIKFGKLIHFGSHEDPQSAVDMLNKSINGKQVDNGTSDSGVQREQRLPF
jgi:hypothetical protein